MESQSETEMFGKMLDGVELRLLERREELYAYIATHRTAPISGNRQRSLAAVAFTFQLLKAPKDREIEKIDRALRATQTMRDNAPLLACGATPDQLMRNAYGLEELEVKQQLARANNASRERSAQTVKEGLDNIARAISMSAGISAVAMKETARMQMT